MELDELYGLATGMGSLPFTNPGEALDLIYRSFPQVPHWPQLPARGAAEGFVAQYLAPLFSREIIVNSEQGTPRFNEGDPRWEERCLSFYEMLLAEEGGALEPFAFPTASAAGFYAFCDSAVELPAACRCLKGQLSGPVTVGFQVTDAKGTPSFYHPVLRELLVKTLAAQARWQGTRLRSLGLPALLFIDDPGLYSYGTSTAVALGRSAIQSALGEIIEAIRAAGCLCGVHCCASTDWSLLLELPLDLISFDAYDYFPSMQIYSEAVDDYLARGGALAWGIVPTSEKAREENPDSLRSLLDDQVETLVRQGVNEARLRRQFMLTPSCGTGTLTADLARHIYGLTAALAEKLQV